MTIINKRMTVVLDKPVVVFLVGVRINKGWNVIKWAKILRTMPKILRELRQQKIPGFISGELWYGRNTMMIQYWEDFELLAHYAKNVSKTHMPIWTYFNLKLVSSADVGVWHETYTIDPGKSSSYESIYTNMPCFGLGNVGKLVEINNLGDKSNANKRIQAD